MVEAADLTAALDRLATNRLSGNKKRWGVRLDHIREAEIERAIAQPRRPPLREDKDALRVRRDAARLVASINAYKDVEGAGGSRSKRPLCWRGTTGSWAMH